MSDTCVRYKCNSTCFSFARFLLTRVGLALHVPPQDLRELHQAVFAFPSNYTITWQKIAMNMICKNYEHKIRAKNSNVPKKTKQNAHFFVFRSISNFSWVECCWADSSLTRNELASLSAFSSWLILACASASAARVVSSWPLFSVALEKNTNKRMQKIIYKLATNMSDTCVRYKFKSERYLRFEKNENVFTTLFLQKNVNDWSRYRFVDHVLLSTRQDSLPSQGFLYLLSSHPAELDATSPDYCWFVDEFPSRCFQCGASNPILFSYLCTSWFSYCQSDTSVLLSRKVTCWWLHCGGYDSPRPLLLGSFSKSTILHLLDWVDHFGKRFWLTPDFAQRRSALTRRPETQWKLARLSSLGICALAPPALKY